MDKNCAQRFGVVGLEAFDHEFDRCIVLRSSVSSQSSFIENGLDKFTIFAREKLLKSKTMVYFLSDTHFAIRWNIGNLPPSQPGEPAPAESIQSNTRYSAPRPPGTDRLLCGAAL